MRVEVQLFSILRDRLPPDAKRGRTTVSLADGATLADLIAHLGIDQQLGYRPQEIAAQTGWQTLVNDKIEKDVARALRDGDDVKLLPPVSGG